MVVVVTYQPAGLDRAVWTDLPEALAVCCLPVVARQKVGVRIQLDTDIQIEQIDYTLLQRRVKSRIRLCVKGNLASTNEAFTYNDEFFIGPLSYF